MSIAGWMRELGPALIDGWTWRMALRDTRGARSRLLVYSLSIVVGVAALVAIASFGRDVEEGIEQQSKGLLGADLVIGSRQPFPKEAELLFKELGGEQSRETSFSTMIYFPAGGGSRLLQVRALSGGFPYYGDMETFPDQARSEFRRGEGVLVEESVLAQFGATRGDKARFGEWTAPIAGALRKVPGETMAFATMIPRAYISMEGLSQTGLLKAGSLVRYRVYFKFPPSVELQTLVKGFKPRLDALKLAHQTAQDRKEDLGRSMANLQRFLSLSGFVALLLGSVGMASSIHLHVKERLGPVAVMRCVGARVAQTLAVYLVQAFGIGLVGALLGALLGVLAQQALPRIAADFLPLQVSPSLHGGVVFRSLIVSVGTALLFALMPLLRIRFVSPCEIIRLPFDSSAARATDPVALLLKCLVGIVVTAYIVRHSEKWTHGIAIAGGLASTVLLLAAAGIGLGKAARSYIPKNAPFIWRQGLANLYRPNNRTVLTVVALGFGTFLVLTLSMVHSNLLREFVTDSNGTRPNMVLFDIQPDQRAEVIDVLKRAGAPILDVAPVVVMRLASVKGVPVDKLLADKSKTIPNWVLRREFRSTYRDHLVDSEKLVAGRWVPSVGPNPRGEPVPISMEEGIAKDLKVTLGDEVVFDVQGVKIRTQVASLRNVDWRRVQANFFVLFPQGVLEEAPLWFIVATRTGDALESARVQQAVVQDFPTVSVLDLTLVMRTVDDVVGKIAFAVRFMALFTIATGLLVLAGAVWSGRTQRISECVLLRTLGASRYQVLGILFTEYFFLGALGAATGGTLAVAASWALATFVFKMAFSFALLPVLAGCAAVCVITVASGLLASLGLTRHPPLMVLRTS